ncbi:MAG: hypothetical protein IPJ00_09360 [Saprospirales bacterium]|nr:hypothetical protein [Saprospirales bacterium]
MDTRSKPIRLKVGDPHALADGNIQSMFFEDSPGNLWFNTVEAIHCYDRKNDFSNYGSWTAREKAVKRLPGFV